MLRINAKKVAICSINHTYTCSRWCLVQSWDSRASQFQSRLLMDFLNSNDARFNGFSFFLFRFLPSFCGKIVNRGHMRLTKHVHRLFESRAFIDSAAGALWSIFRPYCWSTHDRLGPVLTRRSGSRVPAVWYWLATRVRKSRSRATAKYGNYYTLSIINRCVISPFPEKTHAWLHSLDQSTMRHFTLLKKNQCVI